MGTTTHDIFGANQGAERATPGSYGTAPRGGFRLPGATRLGPVSLQVADLARSLAFYEQVLGLRVQQRDDATATLTGADDAPLVRLHAKPDARPMSARGRLGLYHFAILLPDRSALGRFVRHLGALGVRAGAGDHLVSEAFYLQDPDGLGIEVYADRPRDTWRRQGRELMMATDPVDMSGLVAAAGDAPWIGMPAGTVMGHVHLHVGDLPTAGAFYAEGLGFDRMVTRYPGALFLAAGGYHHHLGTNTWAGSGARTPTADDARLLEWTVVLPDAQSVAAAAASLTRHGASLTTEAGDDVLATDPWGTTVRIRAETPRDA